MNFKPYSVYDYQQGLIFVLCGQLMRKNKIDEFDNIIEKIRELDPYWLNTSSNELIIRCIRDCTKNIKITIGKLLIGKSIPFIYDEHVTYKNYNTLNSVNNVLNLLFASGYLTVDRKEIDVFGKEITYVKIPNMEVNFLFNNYLLEILVSDNADIINLMGKFCLVILENNKENIEKLLNQILPMVYKIITIVKRRKK